MKNLKTWQKIAIVVVAVIILWFIFKPTVVSLLVNLVFFVAGALIFRNNADAANKIIDKVVK